MERVLVNIVDVINEADGSCDKIFIYQEKDIQVSEKGLKSLVNTNWLYYNMAHQEVSETDTGFQCQNITPAIQYRCLGF